jgi:hypothetical protein
MRSGNGRDPLVGLANCPRLLRTRFFEVPTRVDLDFAAFFR